MEGFTYHNIFETKGIEYLAIISFFLVLIPYWYFLNRKLKPQYIRATQKGHPFSMIPNGLIFNEKQTWSFLYRNGIARVGLNELISRVTGDWIVNILPESGQQIKRGDKIAQLVTGGHSICIFSPVAGTIVRINQQIMEDPEIRNEPYEKAWLIEIKPESWIADITGGKVAIQAREWLQDEWSRMRDFIIFHSAQQLDEKAIRVLQDGGELSPNPMKDLPEKVWENFEKEFLSLEE